MFREDLFSLEINGTLAPVINHFQVLINHQPSGLKSSFIAYCSWVFMFLWSTYIGVLQITNRNSSGFRSVYIMMSFHSHQLSVMVWSYVYLWFAYRSLAEALVSLSLLRWLCLPFLRLVNGEDSCVICCCFCKLYYSFELCFLQHQDMHFQVTIFSWTCLKSKHTQRNSFQSFE